jgi:acetyl-CoA carboxylase beta subunit
MKSFKTVLGEGKLDDFDKAYNTWIKATKKLTATFEAAATNKAGVTSFKAALAKIEKAIDKGDMRS